MKSIFKFTFFLASTFLISGCASDSPEEVAEKFIKAVNAGDIQKASKYCSAESIPMLNLAASMGALTNEAQGELRGIICEVDSTGNKAFCKVKFIKDGVELEDDMNLAKIDGEWKAVLSKEK